VEVGRSQAKLDKHKDKVEDFGTHVSKSSWHMEGGEDFFATGLWDYVDTGGESPPGSRA
jgi:hypothetical protein